MATLGDWSELQLDGSTEIPLTLVWDSDPLEAAGYHVAWLDEDTPVIEPLQLVDVEPPNQALIPLAPALAGSQPTRTSTQGSWVAADNTGRPPVSSWEVERRISTDDRASFGAWAPITGSPFAANVFSFSQSGLSSGTPEHVFQYRVRGVNADGPGLWSNILDLQWPTAPLQQPTGPTNFRLTGQTPTTRSFAWDASADGTVSKFTIFDDGIIQVDNIDDGLRALTVTNLQPGLTYTGWGIARYNGWSGTGAAGLSGYSPMSNLLNFTQPTTQTPTFEMLMGCSASNNDHGGTEDWDGWRVYTRAEMLNLANRTGANRPLYLAYSVDGTPLGSSGNAGVSTLTYTAIFNYVKGELDNFYYTGGATSQVHSGRWGIRLYWSNGNENSDKGILSNPTQANIDNFVNISQKALYDAVHFIDTTTGQRRFPDAYAGSNPTQEHERLGIVQAWLHPSAKYHDFVMWSEYPPGRGVNDPQLAVDPRFDWPSFNEADRLNRQQGYLIRCYYRTFQAQAAARNELQDGDFSLIIGCGEVGIASDPSDRTQRPYYTARALLYGMYALAIQYSLQLDFVCWWDNQTSATSPHNILTDEPPTSDHADATGAGSNSTATNPSTREVVQNWMDYEPRVGGALPSQWAGNPKASWNTTGPVV